MIAIGIGCRAGAAAEDILAVIHDALATLPGAVAGGLYTLAEKSTEPGLGHAAAALGLPLVSLDVASLRAVAGGALTRSPRVEALHGLPSVAETAALAGAGPGAVLLVARRANKTATCAIAEGPR
jgi:cobalt-precorrin 5A hydrolase